MRESGTQIKAVHILTAGQWLRRGMIASRRNRQGWFIYLVAVWAIRVTLAGSAQGGERVVQGEGAKAQVVIAYGFP